MYDDGEVLFGGRAIAAELSRLTGREVPEKTAFYWIQRGVIRARRAGHFLVATKTSLREDLSPESASAQ
jgi:hypothetical protein